MASMAVSRLPKAVMSSTRGVGGARLRGGEDLEPAHVVHDEVREDDVVVRALDDGEGLAAARRSGHREPLALEVTSQHGEHLRVIVHHQHPGRLTRLPRGLGSHAVKVAP